MRYAELRIEGSPLHRTGWVRRATWEDVLIAHYGREWRVQAENPEPWAASCQEFIKSSMDAAGLPGTSYERRRKRKKRGPNGRPSEGQERRERVVPTPAYEEASERPSPWALASRPCWLVHISGDNLAVVNWMNGRCRCLNPRLLLGVRRAMKQMWRWEFVRPLHRGGDWFGHKHREHNKQADALATEAITTRRSRFRNHLDCVELERDEQGRRRWWPMKLRASFDGGARRGLAGAGWWIEASIGGGWQRLFDQALYLDKATSTTAEVAAATDVVDFLGEIFAVKCWEDLRELGGERLSSTLRPESRARLVLRSS